MNRLTMRQGRTRQTRRSPRRDRRGRTFEQRQRQVFAFIVRFAVENMGHMPTLRDICAGLDIDSTSSVAYCINALVKKDKLRYHNGFLVIPGSRFEWRDEYDDVADADPALSATNRPTESDTDGAAGLHRGGGDRPLVSQGDVPGRMAQGTRS